MTNILIVEDNQVYAKSMAQAVSEQFDMAVEICSTAAQARQALSENSFDLCVVDLILPDSDGSFIKEICEEQNVIVSTSFEDEATRTRITSLNIIDYIIKSDSIGFSYLINIIRRLIANKHMNVLVVEDSKTMQNHISSLLKLLHLNPFTADDGAEGLKLLDEKSGQFDLILTDYEMPNMDGLAFLKEVRKRHTIDDLPVLVLSSVGRDATIARFLKAGANDYITKPFSKEEFICRINLSLNNVELLNRIKHKASFDFLTKLHNRAYLDERMESLSEVAKKHGSLAAIDIDYFKKINDIYGHHTGDVALKFFADKLRENFNPSDLIRVGGEEFLVILPEIDLKKAVLIMNQFRKDIENQSFESEDGDTLRFTVSIGVTSMGSVVCEEALKNADKHLYKAKENGRNRVEFGELV